MLLSRSTGQAVWGVWLCLGFPKPFPLLSRRLVVISMVMWCWLKLGMFSVPWKPGFWHVFGGLFGLSVPYQPFAPAVVSSSPPF